MIHQCLIKKNNAMKDDIKNIWIDLNEELYRFINKKMKDEDLAKDILQESFIKILSNIDQLKDTSKLTSWIYQITRNTIIDYYRKSRLQTFSIYNFDILENEADDFEYSQLSNCIHQKIEQLSTKHHQAISLTSFKNISQKELANLLDISYSGAKSRVQKARNILKENIKDCPNAKFDKFGKLLDFNGGMN